MIEGDDVSSRIEYLKRDMPLTSSPNGKLGVVNVGRMKRFVESESVDNGKLTVTHEPDANPENPELDRDYHCGVRGIKYDDIMIELLYRGASPNVIRPQTSRDEGLSDFPQELSAWTNL